ncbi:cyclic pyranopterin monophosphate synthase MoaC [bacterium]|nr:cyclic pyranopterin monophosphate synthase MoaC [bacterium]
MVDVAEKSDTHREAFARGFIHLSDEVIHLIRKNEIKKGNPLEVARLAGIMAAKRTHELIPLCHPLLLTHIELELSLSDEGVEIASMVSCTGKTGVEMEALTAVSVAALTVYDMCKAVDKTMRIGKVQLVKKTGGHSGTFVNPTISRKGTQ